MERGCEEKRRRKMEKESKIKWIGGQNIVYLYVCVCFTNPIGCICICMCSYCDEGLYPLIILRLSAAKRRKMYFGHSMRACVCLCVCVFCVLLLVQANRFVAITIHPILRLFLSFFISRSQSLSLSLYLAQHWISDFSLSSLYSTVHNYKTIHK